MMMNQNTNQSTDIKLIAYIDEAARGILNDLAWGHDADAFDKADPNDYAWIHELLDERIESAAAGAPITLIGYGDLTDGLEKLIYDLLFARCYQLGFAFDLTETDKGN
jgi:hypothetical protein